MTRMWLPADVLPHRPPSLYLTRIVAWDRESLVAEVVVDGGSPLAEPAKGVPRWVALEYMAQAVGALDGIRLREARKSVPPGYLLGTRRLDRTDGYFPPGATLRVSVREVLQGDNGLGAFACQLDDGERSLECQLTVYRPTESQESSGAQG